MESFCASKDTTKKEKRQIVQWKKYMSEKCLVYRINEGY